MSLLTRSHSKWPLNRQKNLVLGGAPQEVHDRSVLRIHSLTRRGWIQGISGLNRPRKMGGFSTSMSRSLGETWGG